MFGSNVQKTMPSQLAEDTYLPSLRKVLFAKKFQRNFRKMTLEVNDFPAKAILPSGSSKYSVDHKVTNILLVTKIGWQSLLPPCKWFKLSLSRSC